MLEVKAKGKENMPKVMVIGIGGGGNNAVTRMVSDASEYVEYAALNTDSMTLDRCPANKRLQLGSKLTQGYGAGGDPVIGESSAKESEEEISNLVQDANMVILTCGMGGGTGTGAIPVVAQICKSLNILTVAVVTMPFSFESQPRVLAAQTGLKKLEQNVDTLLVIPNDKLLTITDKPFYMDEAFTLADSVLKYTIEGMTNIIFNHGTINLDFNDLKSTLKDKGYGLFGIGIANEEETIIDAVEKAMCSPLLETNITGASNILLNTSGKIDIVALNKAVAYIRDQAGENVNIFWGTVGSDSSSSEVVVTLIATGMKQVKSPVVPKQPIPQPEKAIPQPPKAEPLLTPKPATQKAVSETEANLDILKRVNTAADVQPQPQREIRSQVRPLTLEIPPFLKNRNSL
ncbi:cell division protein FtsZ [Butyrivibrio sp. VCD2006]|uniref:cell division protein FtsZ n=1 Tax=Butyrivibrio sp. VCD2006 TaxID=1280664 RepID=UPI00041AE6C0|nr:cell division protein FtsZ [Butyrivibrio sp. VCD2006]